MIATRKTSRLASSGFTLVEVMMAMLIMTIGLLGLLQSVNVAYEHNTRNRLREEALLVGEEQMHQFRRETANATIPFETLTTAVREVAGISKTFRVTRENQPMSSTRKLRVRVAWSFKNQSSTHEIFTLKNM
jgi:type IV pilus assembly protein PilV